MPDGSSSAAPVVMPGPSERSTRRSPDCGTRVGVFTGSAAACGDAEGRPRAWQAPTAACPPSVLADTAVGLVELRGVPAAAKLRYQIDARDQLLALDAEQADFRREPRGLRGQQDGVDDDAGFVLLESQRLGLARVIDRGGL